MTSPIFVLSAGPRRAGRRRRVSSPSISSRSSKRARAWVFRSSRGKLHGRAAARRIAASTPSGSVIRYRCTASACRSARPGRSTRRIFGRLAAVARRFEPALVSEHLAWSTHEGAFFNDLLPLPYTLETLVRVAEHIDEVQNALRRTMLLENPSTYVVFAESTCAETDFLREIARRTGCGLLLDVNNVFVSAANQAYDPYRYLAEFPLEAVGEVHLAGYAEDSDDAGLPLLIDAHNSPVRDPVWALYGEAIRRLGATPTLIEWDNDLPAWPALLDEARRAGRVMAAANANSPERVDAV